MRSAVIVDTVRTAGGKRGGLLSGWHSADLAAEVLSALVRRNDLDPAVIEDAIFGCVTPVGDQMANVGRSAVLAAGLPESIPAVTLDRQCGSGQQAVHFAAQAVMSGAMDVVVAAGVEVMSKTPIGATATPGTFPRGPRMSARYAHHENYGESGIPHQGRVSEMIADKWGLSRDDLDELGERSQALALKARDEGRFANEIVPVVSKRLQQDGSVVETDELVLHDEGIRPGTTREVLAGLRSAYIEGGRTTAGNSSQITDGAGAMLIMSEDRANQLGLRPRARLHTLAVAGSDPVLMLTGPIDATEKALARAGLSVDDIDHFECNEAFASVVLAWQREIKPDPARVNPNGGAIALGHPLGASGIRIMSTMLNELERSGGRLGLQTMCEGGGMANATIIERL